jgi:small conductance mechanosensitive channel
LSRLLRLVTHHMARLAEASAAGSGRMAEVRTMSGVIRATGLAIIVLIAGFMSLGTIGFNLAPLLASAGIAGIAIGLAAQTIVKDMLNGFLILIESQFSVGDSVRLAGVSGVVEALTLRTTSVRDGDGTLYMIPNSQITTVANLSLGSAVATVNVSVDFSAHPDAVIKLLKKIAMDLRNSDDFRAVILEEPQVLGLDSVKGSQMIFPVIFKTRANQQYGLLREFQRRVRLALEENHLLPGDPNRVFQHQSNADTTATPRQPEEAPTPARDATTIKPVESNPFTGE